jgi:CDI toxin RNase A-like protein
MLAQGTVLVFFLLLSGLACQPPQRAVDHSSALQSPRAEAAAAGPRRDLARDEEMGGHTLGKHVGQSDDQLSERLAHERNISAASTWTDRSTAERAVGLALQENQAKVERWLARPGGHSNLVIDYDGDPSRPIGRTLPRSASRSEPCSHAVVVLKWAGGADYYVLTSYPECR